VLVALSAVLMVMDHKYKSLESVRATLSMVIYPIQMLGRGPVNRLRVVQ